jgi:hypothetical protein
MNETEKMIGEIDALLQLLGDSPLGISGQTPEQSELQLLEKARDEYTKRLRQKMPLYHLVPASMIPELLTYACAKMSAFLRQATSRTA